jgi:hypothetical protein
VFKQIATQLELSNDELLLHSVWFMGNVVTEDTECCIYVLENSPVLACLERISTSKISEQLQDISSWFVEQALKKIGLLYKVKQFKSVHI